MRLFILFTFICFAFGLLGQSNVSTYPKSEKRFVGDGINPFYEYIVGNDTIFYSNSFSSGIRDSRTNVIIDAQPKRKLYALEDSLLKIHQNLNFISFYPNISFELYKAVPLIPNLKGFSYNQQYCFGCSHEKIMEFNKLESNVFNAKHYFESGQDANRFQNKITAVIDVTDNGANFEVYPNLKYLEYRPMHSKGSYIVQTSYKRNKKQKGFLDRGYCNVPVSNIYFPKPLPLEILVFREATCHVNIELPKFSNLKKLVLIDSHLPTVWENFTNDSTVQEINLRHIKLSKNIKKVRFENLRKLTFYEVSGDINKIKYDEQFQNLEEIKVTSFIVEDKVKFRVSSLAQLSNLKKIELRTSKRNLYQIKLPVKSKKLTTLHVENSGLYFIPKHLEEFKKLDTLILDVKFINYKNLKEKLLSLPNLKYVRIISSKIQEYCQVYYTYSAYQMNQPMYESKLEKEILSLHPNKDLDIIIESEERAQLLIKNKRPDRWVPYSHK